ncbi:hypothetical protein [Brachybacterium sp. YJGR34]|uniref:hypothetical protein n=1 Tax=Brachybacterium sp. YJGR34 TaxID=2059911 RepID=UPI000E0B7102|nr:hypothetical protein [Brachybacterium sp. YJGR34]
MTAFERSEILDRIFGQLAAQQAERLSQPISEAEVERSVAALDRAERLASIRTDMREAAVTAFGRELTVEETTALTRACVKGRLPSDEEMAGCPPELVRRIMRAAAQHAQRRAAGSGGSGWGSDEEDA